MSNFEHPSDQRLLTIWELKPIAGQGKLFDNPESEFIDHNSSHTAEREINKSIYQVAGHIALPKQTENHPQETTGKLVDKI